MVAGAALAQTPGPSVEPPSSRGIIPVTGPSTVPAFPEAPKSELVQEKVTTAQDPRKGAAGRRAVSTAAPAAPRSVKAVKSAQKPQAKTAVKTPSATKHAAKAGHAPEDEAGGHGDPSAAGASCDGRQAHSRDQAPAAGQGRSPRPASAASGVTPRRGRGRRAYTGRSYPNSRVWLGSSGTSRSPVCVKPIPS